ncbi:MAG: rhodanese-like domain-containing protein [Fulvivirga sp.]|uniref:rhodanese-like domain-containing protein n=1 Tax=Fulvivirga sp. TaxID=1931237 RepID=UPI0032EDB8AF
MSVISATELKTRLTKGEALIIIDVRETWEYDEYNIGADNIPLGDLPHSLEQLDYCREQEVIVHCKSGSRSNQAMKYLTQQGFKNVKSLEGGIEGYLG